jgi:hypothetical protein
MYGLDAINAHNGWAQAFAGACIVLSGLSVLSFIISLLPKLVGLFEKDEKAAAPVTAPEPALKPLSETEVPLETDAAANLYGPLITSLGEEFQLQALHELFKEQNLPHPHITIRNFRDAGLLTPTETGAFLWTAK